jgi:hypothetical protein
VLKRFDPTTAVSESPLLVVIIGVTWTAVLLAGQGMVNREQYEWVLRSLSFSSGERPTFKGRLLPYIGWTLLTVLSFFTVVGWGRSSPS